MTDSHAAVVLAAGAGSRMGGRKQLLSVGGETLVARAVRAAREAECAPIVVVVGAHASEIRRAAEAPDIVIAFNRRWRSGMAGSIRAGLARVGRTDAVYLLLADQPLVGVSLLRRLAQALAASGRQVAACRYGEILGAPALFRRSWLARLARLTGEQGARSLLAKESSRVAAVDFPEGVADIDTPEDARRWLPSLRACAGSAPFGRTGERLGRMRPRSLA